MCRQEEHVDSKTTAELTATLDYLVSKYGWRAIPWLAGACDETLYNLRRMRRDAMPDAKEVVGLRRDAARVYRKAFEDARREVDRVGVDRLGGGGSERRNGDPDGGLGTEEN